MQSANIIAPIFLPLSDVASYGLMLQILTIMVVLSQVYFLSLEPQIVQYRTQHKTAKIRKIYFRSLYISIAIFFVVGGCLLVFGNWALGVIGSQTQLPSTGLIVFALFVFLLEVTYSNSEGFILSGNEIPFFRSEILSGIATLILLYLLLSFSNLGIWSLILATAIVQCSYQYWKWTTYALKQLKVNHS
jgi:O-antigen/teichoic acid export membrane protein